MNGFFFFFWRVFWKGFFNSRYDNLERAVETGFVYSIGKFGFLRGRDSVWKFFCFSGIIGVCLLVLFVEYLLLSISGEFLYFFFLSDCRFVEEGFGFFSLCFFLGFVYGWVYSRRIFVYRYIIRRWYFF